MSRRNSCQSILQLRSDMDFFGNRYYKINRFFMSLIGQWPYQSSKKRVLGTTFVVLVFNSALFVQLAKLFTTDYSMDFVIQILQTVIPCLSFTANVCTYYVNAGNTKKALWISNYFLQMKSLVEQIKYDWNVIKVAEELRIIQKYAEQGRMYTIIITAFFSVALIIFMLSANSPYVLDIVMPLNESRAQTFIFPAEYFVDQQKYFYPILLHTYIVIVIGVTVSVALFPMYMCYIQHACGMFSVVGYQLEHAFDKKIKTIYYNEHTFQNEIARAKVIRSIEFHKRVLRFTEIMISSFSPSYFIQLILLFVHLTVEILRMFQAFTLLNNLDEIVMSTLNVCSVLLCIFLGCYTGQKLLDHSASVYDKVSRWFTASPNTQKLVLFIIFRSIKPSSIRVNDSLTSSYKLFASTLQSALSYFTVLYSLR